MENFVSDQVSVASTEQASSADNISEEVGGNMNRPRTHATDLSAINTSTHHINTGTFSCHYHVNVICIVAIH